MLTREQMIEELNAGRSIMHNYGTAENPNHVIITRVEDLPGPAELVRKNPAEARAASADLEAQMKRLQAQMEELRAVVQQPGQPDAPETGKEAGQATKAEGSRVAAREPVKDEAADNDGERSKGSRSVTTKADDGKSKDSKK